MSELGALLELIHDAHSRLTTFEAEYRDWNRPRPSLELRVERSELGDARPRWRGAGPFPAPVAHTRRIWLNASGALRVEVASGHELRKLGVLGVDRWWLWDRDSGAVSDALMLDRPAGGTPAPALLTPPLLSPASLLAALRFDVVGPAVRAGREVIRARAVPRRPQAAARALLYELDFDAEHGTVLHRVALERGHVVSLTEADAVAYKGPIEQGRFVFTSPDGQPVREVQSEPLLPGDALDRRAVFRP
jgi:hypothetical protein